MRSWLNRPEKVSTSKSFGRSYVLKINMIILLVPLNAVIRFSFSGDLTVVIEHFPSHPSEHCSQVHFPLYLSIRSNILYENSLIIIKAAIISFSNYDV